MNDLDLVRELTIPDAPLLLPAELAGARQRVLAQIPARRPPRRHRRRMRPVVLAAVTAGAAAAVAAGFLAGTRAPGRPAAPAPSPAADAHLTAVQVLDRAAAAALAEPAVIPRPEQFVYTEVDEGAPGTAGSVIVQTWLSVDGTRNGLSVTTAGHGKTSSTQLLGCSGGQHRVRTPGIGGKPLRLGGQPMTPEQYKQKYGTSVPMDGPVLTEPCTAQPGYLPGMPTSAQAMAGYLERTQGIRLPNLNDLAKTVGYLLESDYLRPAQRAALYQFLASTPGLVVEHHVRDVSGRPGVGVGWSFAGGTAMNIFDPATFAYLGLSTRGQHGQLGGDALVQTAVVNHPGQLP